MIFPLLMVFVSGGICDWVEIPQASKRIDLSTYILTTTSTTTQTPVLARPNENRRAFQRRNTTRRNEPVKATIIRLNTVPSVTPVFTNKSPKTSNNPILDSLSIDKTKVFPKKIEDRKQVETLSIAENNENDESKANSATNAEDNEDMEQQTSNSFITYISNIQNTLLNSVQGSKKSKLRVLKNLRDHLLSEIKNRISRLWHPNKGRETREAREYKEESHVDFPSNEGALMTIGFLTFAVFLIKLVLHLIQTIHTKMDATTMTTNSMAAALLGRKRRSVVNKEAVKILNYIDQYTFK